MRSYSSMTMTQNMLQLRLRDGWMNMILDWPTYSPDLNPIKHLWNEMDRQLRKLPGSISSKDNLWNKIQQVWNEIDVEFCLRLIDTMPQRIADVLKARSGYTWW